MSETDETLVSRTLQLKDTTAYGELVRRYEQKILLLQQRLTGERALAEDLAQETFLRAWQKLDTFSGTGSFGGWLASVGYNVFRAHWRKHKRQNAEVPLDDLTLRAPAQDETGSAELDRLLGLLPRQDQVILTLSYAYGLSNSEVGQVLEMPAGTVKARIHRAKARIRATLANPTPASDATPAPPAERAPAEGAPAERAPAGKPGASAVTRRPWLGRQRAGKPLAGISTGSLTC